MLKKICFISALLLVLAAVLYSCKKENTSLPAEPQKAIDGSWKIVQALRNGTDLTSRFDFSKFRIVFSDSSYTLTNPVPFLVTKNGHWSFDDPQYPAKVFFRAENGVSATSSVNYPVVKGIRNIIISFSPGCVSNSYTYTLEKE
ncbi:MAG: DUF5004 domain-containing protein [Chitinophagaceae bacterium]|nr:MAG: DUF5004 domain-containing protein [Chitinophagaceae bacterium]